MALLVFDGLLIALCLVAALWLAASGVQARWVTIREQSLLIPWAVLSGLAVLYFSGWYRCLTLYTGSHSLYSLLPRALTALSALWLISRSLGGAQPPPLFWLLYGLLFIASSVAGRILLRDLLRFHLERLQRKAVKSPSPSARTKTAIYGAGHSGAALLEALRNDQRFAVCAFIDDDDGLNGRTLHGQTVYGSDAITHLIDSEQLQQVLLALPTASRERKRRIVDQLTRRGLEVLSIPSLTQLASGQSMVTDLRQVSIEDLLGREPSIPDQQLLLRVVREKAVLVTGAGGSIGRELCEQVSRLGPRLLLMLERSELALYTIERDLHEDSTRCCKLIAVLGDATDSKQLISLCHRYSIQTIFHAAAYKHVPMVESNLCAGVANNIHATRSVIEAARLTGVERVTLISTDKAVRPTNVMGTSKRICELLIQDAADQVAKAGFGPIFAMVRFGNVLGSSGSVIPLFHQQIARGGPVTVTHPEVTRYFMTIPEAVQLVLQATGMANGGDLFVLDMGQPVRIADLARQMIELSGLRVRDQENSSGDISIDFTGLRPGEKLYEELLIGSNDEPTSHPLIRRAREPLISTKSFWPLIEQLEAALHVWDERQTATVLKALVPEYQGHGLCVSHR